MRGTTSAGPRRETAEVSTDPPIEIAGAFDSLILSSIAAVLCFYHKLRKVLGMIDRVCVSGQTDERSEYPLTHESSYTILRTTRKVSVYRSNP
jgi:hypothetical protein